MCDKVCTNYFSGPDLSIPLWGHSMVPLSNGQAILGGFFFIYGIMDQEEHTAGSDIIFVQIYMDPPPGVPGVSKDAPGSTKHAI